MVPIGVECSLEKRHNREMNMAAESSGEVKIIPTFGLTGVTIMQWL
jgi:hypothetical protein